MLHLLEVHTGFCSVFLLFIIVVFFFAGNARRQGQGSHCNSTRPDYPPQELPSTQLFTGHKFTPSTHAL